MGLSAVEKEGRSALFLEIADFLVLNNILPSDLVLFEKKVALSVDAYCMLNEAYKRWRITPGHRTQNAKIAAISCVAIYTISPFRFVGDPAKASLAHSKANEIFALTCASTILNAALKYGSSPHSNLMYRIIDIISASRSETLEPLLIDLSQGIRRDPDDYHLTIHESDKLSLNALISIFELVPPQVR